MDPGTEGSESANEATLPNENLQPPKHGASKDTAHLPQLQTKSALAIVASKIPTVSNPLSESAIATPHDNPLFKKLSAALDMTAPQSPLSAAAIKSPAMQSSADSSTARSSLRKPRASFSSRRLAQPRNAPNESTELNAQWKVLNDDRTLLRDADHRGAKNAEVLTSENMMIWVNYDVEIWQKLDVVDEAV